MSRKSCKGDFLVINVKGRSRQAPPKSSICFALLSRQVNELNSIGIPYFDDADPVQEATVVCTPNLDEAVGHMVEVGPASCN